MRRIVIFFITLYQYLISPLLGPRCRYYPTCSEYAQTAVGRFGVFRGGWMAMKRIGRCHPWHEGGIDPVPEELHKHTHKNR